MRHELTDLQQRVMVLEHQVETIAAQIEALYAYLHKQSTKWDLK